MSDISFWNAMSLSIKEGTFTYEKLCDLVDNNISAITDRHLIKSAFKAMFEALKAEEVKIEEAKAAEQNQENSTIGSYTPYKSYYRNELTELLTSKDSVSLINDIVPMIRHEFRNQSIGRRGSIVLDDYMQRGVLSAGPEIYAYPKIEVKDQEVCLTDFIYRHR